MDAFLRTLLRHQEPASQADIKILRDLKQKEQRLDHTPTLEAYDRFYYTQMADKLNAQSRASPRSLFFTVGAVMQGLSRLFKGLYGIQFEPASLQANEAWHDEVRKLDVVCEKEGKIGTIYCDLFARPGKTTHAAHYTVRTSRRTDDDDADRDIQYAFPGRSIAADQFLPPQVQSQDVIRGRQGRYQLPIIALTCDFNRMSGQGLLSLHEVETLFHEMGHAMHSMLGRTDYHNVAGTRCPTDFVELPSLLMEHFLWHPSVVPLYSGHHPPERVLQAMKHNPRNHFSGLEVNGQIVMALIDQQYHSAAPLEPDFSASRIWQTLQDKDALFRHVPGTMWPVQFGHLFGYGAGYYSYLFDRTLARRVWERCFAMDPLDRKQGQAFRERLLDWGGARDPWQSVADVLRGEDGDRISAGDETAMRTVGDWGIDV